MQEAQTLSEIIIIFKNSGYIEDFQVLGNKLKAMPSGLVFQPESLLIDKFFRFEGETDLNEESIIFALSCPVKKIKGSYLVAFGPMMDPMDSKMVLRLEKKVSS